MQSFNLKHPEELQHHLLPLYEFYMPVQSPNGGVSWLCIEQNSPFDYDPELALPISSCKAFFFPEREEIFKFDGTKFVSKESGGGKQVLFGVHACDLTAIAYQDQFFAEDRYYQAKREQTLLVGIDCISQCELGFCHQVNAGPLVNVKTADLILQPPFENRMPWTLLVVSQKGMDAIEGMALSDSDSESDGDSGEHVQARERMQREVVKQFLNMPDLEKGVEKINKKQVSQSQWERLAKQCVTCSGCTQVCPTCSCYTTRDIAKADSVPIHRERVWDSCLFEGFQREASGHNPSRLAGQRLERFWYHKFSDDFVAQFNRYGCVGCGRCERVCPGVIGVHSIMKRLNDHE